MTRRIGRRPGKQDTRGRILSAARGAFARYGFEGATIRQIAATAHVDPALVHHYFGTKHDLFLAVLELPLDPVQVLEGALTGPREQVGERIVRTFLTTWDSPVGSAGVALLRSAVTHERSAKLFHTFIFQRMARHLVPQLDLPAQESELRVAAIASQIAGVAMLRYLMRIEPLASAPVEQLVQIYGPTIQRYLDDELVST